MKRTRTRPTGLFTKWEIAARPHAIWETLTPPQLFVVSFLVLVLLGTLGFRFLPGLYVGEHLSWLDSLFTATSAVCVTGLIVEDTATFFTPLGQAYILLLFQVGGLGIITFTSLIIIALGRRLSLRQEALSTGTLEVAPHVSRKHLIRDVLRFTLAIEGAGAMILYLLWAPEMGWREAAWPAVFHAVSGFCNAGFSIFSDSLIGHRESPLVMMTIITLIVTGGLGFLALEELNLRRKAARTDQIFRVSLHTRIVLSATAVLLLGGWVMFLIFEWYGVLQPMSVLDRVTNALFMSATARTCGFSTIDYSTASHSSQFLTILLMTIGGAPGSTAGGMKVTTIALIGLLAWTRFRGREIVNLWGRSVPMETVERAVGLFVVAFGALTVAIFILTTTELSPFSRFEFIDCMFEATSAFNTVGLSTGMTPELSTGGRWSAIVLMFIGRVGPLTFAAALAQRRAVGAGKLRYAYEDVVVG